MWETNLKIFVNIAKRKVIRQNNVQKEKENKVKKVEKKLIMHRKLSMETMLLTIQVKKIVVTTLLVFGDETWYVNFGASMHVHHRRDWFFEFEWLLLVKIYMG